MRKVSTIPFVLGSRLLSYFGYEVLPRTERSKKHEMPDVDLWITDIIGRVSPYTMTSPERVAAVCMAVEYVARNRIPGDIVECGVWKGGSSMAAALALLRCGDTTRTIHLFDTFEGMSEPTHKDQELSGQKASELLAKASRQDPIWAYSPLEEVTRNLLSTGYPKDRVKLIQGKVETTIPEAAPASIAMLRLDTDWYESTLWEMQHLFPILADGGVLIIDDYGHWAGARTAVDEYVAKTQTKIFLSRIDYTGRIAIKLPSSP
jgi:O-methyltransferase